MVVAVVSNGLSSLVIVCACLKGRGVSGCYVNKVIPSIGSYLEAAVIETDAGVWFCYRLAGSSVLCSEGLGWV